MADQELVKILRQGVDVWNRWRQQQPASQLMDLSGASLSGSNLRGADLVGVNLSNADLIKADLSGAILIEANLSNANLANTEQVGTSLIGSNLANANMTEANLAGANLSAIELTGADLSRATLWLTTFSYVDLRTVKGLATLNHRGPSSVALQSVQLPQDGSALHFLRGCGVPDEWIADYRAHVMDPIQYHSCFISYVHQDDDFAHRLHSDLQDRGVRCWFAPHDMKTGDKIRSRIDEAIHLQDKLLLILSEHSVSSEWVEHEVETALAKERREKRTMLFPIRLDNTILEREYTGWAALVQNERYIGDFTGWKDHDRYQVAFDRLLRDLKQADE